MSEIALFTLVHDELETSNTNAHVAVNPYLMLLDTLTNASTYKTLADQKVLSDVCYYLGISRQYSVFDAVTACITAQAKENQSRVENDKLVQVIVRIAARTLQVAVREEEAQGRGAGLLSQFARKLLLTPSSVTSPLTSFITTTALSIENLSRDATVRRMGHFWARVVRHFCIDSTMAALSWSERAICVGNVLELAFHCSFDGAFVEVIPFVLSELMTLSLVQWAFDVKHSKQDLVMDDEDYDMDDDGNVPSVLLSVQDFALDEKVQRGVEDLGDAEPSVRAQWQKLCHSKFAPLCLDVLLRMNNGTPELVLSGKSPVCRLCDVLATVILSTGRSHVLTIAANFTNPPPALLALLSAMTVEQSPERSAVPSSNTNLVNSMWQRIRSAIKSSTSQHPTPLFGECSLDTTTVPLQVLLIFNVVYSHMLLGLDDEAFYDGQWPLRLCEVEALVTFLKQFIYDACWIFDGNSALPTGTMDERDLVRFAVVVTSLKLFNQLYDRDCRRRFMPDGAWLWPSMPTIREIVDLELMNEDGPHGADAIYMLMNGKASSPYARAALILVTIPQVLSFNERVQLFQKLLDDAKAQAGNTRDEFSRALQVRIQRHEIVRDGYDFFRKVCDVMSPAALKSRIKVTFINEQGLEEAGIDGGGVFKEFMDNLTKNAFSPEFGFFLETDDHLLYPNSSAKFIVDTPKEALERYRFLGRLLAKAVFENILVEPQFAAFFLNKLLGKFNYIDDLHSLDPELYTSLMRLKHYDGNVEDLALTFSVSEVQFDKVVTRNLLPDGSNVPVTNENRIRYIHLMANYKLNVLTSIECAAFLMGFRDLIPGSWIQMFAPAEVQMLIGGTATNIDVDDWERHTQYGGGYHPSQAVIQWFWEIVKEDFTLEDRAALLKFITSCSRQPLLGFSKLVPQIGIHQVRVEDDERLPSSATCMNLLKLPAYSNKKSMRRKLMYAIRSNAGFDLS
uniref:HECT-type E3 ubiquitin transferase n=1 Tax=Hyaloperonospora arabidopsidis (strain Emoy2) TaxID=559515 RepID=M4BPZ5_HYAAE